MTARLLAVGAAAALLAGACVADDPGVRALPGTSLGEGYAVDLVTDGFDRPTQLAHTGQGDLVIAELAGVEDAGTGRILRFDLDDPRERETLQTGLNKPTGIAVVGETLWVMEERTLSYTSLEVGAALNVFLDELPFNGRSQGSLTPTPDGGLLFNTSGRKSGAEVADGSGSVFRIEAADPIGTGSDVAEPTVVATGLKHAYAHAFDIDGQLWSTEMTDGSFDGEPAPDELVAMADGDNFDWPACVGDRQPVIEFGGSTERCETGPPSHALFEPRATPTAVEVAPWDPDLLVVALWVDDQVVVVPRETPVAGELWQPEVAMSGIGNPQDLVIDGERLLVVDHGGSRILALSRE